MPNKHNIWELRIEFIKECNFYIWIEEHIQFPDDKVLPIQ